MRSIVLSSFLILCFACSINKNFVTHSGIIQPSSEQQALIYSLPQTVVNVNIEVIKTTIQRGPYAEYALKYLNISNAPMVNSQEWQIINVDIKTAQEPDPTAFYSIIFKNKPDNLSQLFAQTNKGLILDFATAWKTPTMNYIEKNTNDNQLIPYVIDDIIVEKSDTTFKSVYTDSAWVKMPIVKKKTIIKTPEEIAKANAHELIKTRKRRLKYLRGEYEYHPDGAALNVMATELEQKEKDYLELFMGRKTIEKKQYTFTVVPDSTLISKPICYFSSILGVKQIKTKDSRSVMLSMEREQLIPKGSISKIANNTVLYRIPQMINAKIVIDSIEIATKRIPVYQIGGLQQLVLKP